MSELGPIIIEIFFWLFATVLLNHIQHKKEETIINDVENEYKIAVARI